MKRILAILAVIFSLCIAASSVADQTNEQDQSVYIYSIVKFKNTLQNSTWKVSLTVDFGQADYKETDKVVDADGNLLNYSMSATLNGIKYESYFPDVPWLPRNTHVVTVVTIKDHGVNWTVDVYPYGEYWLNPGFGI